MKAQVTYGVERGVGGASDDQVLVQEFAGVRGGGQDGPRTGHGMAAVK